MPQGEHFDATHQRLAAMRPRPKKVKVRSEDLHPGETLDEASLRLQKAKADKERELADQAQMETAKMRGELVTKAEAIDLAQAAVLRCCSILDLLPERLRDRLCPENKHLADLTAEVIEQARAEIAAG